jgi:diguanylate cyclase (GGDEF)-like protein
MGDCVTSRIEHDHLLQKHPVTDIAPPGSTSESAIGRARDADERYTSLVMACDQGVVVAVDSIVVLVNDTAVGLLGAIAPTELIGRALPDLIAPLPAAKVDDSRDGAPVYLDAMAHRIDGSAVAINAVSIGCRFDGREAVQVLLRNIGQHRVLERRVQFLLQHDTLTELPNRTEFRDRLVGAMARATRNQRLVGIMLIDIDDFSLINKRHGSEIGDVVLREVALRIKSSIRLADSAARIGSDGFGVILEALDQREQAAVVANRIVQNLKPPILAGDARITVTCSAGVAAFPVDAPDIDHLLRMADVAMLAANAGGGNTFRFYFPDMEAATKRDEVRRSDIEKRLATLTPREHEVMTVLVDGNSNKAIAYLLGASPRTIENHRAKVMTKMMADSLPDLVRMVMEAAGGEH